MKSSGVTGEFIRLLGEDKMIPYEWLASRCANTRVTISNIRLRNGVKFYTITKENNQTVGWISTKGIPR